MAEQAGEVKTLLEGIIKRLDAQTETSEKRHGEQLAINAQISTDLAGVRKQLMLTQADVDETRKALSASPGSVTSSSHDTRLANATAPPRAEIGARLPQARLTNEGAPLMPEPPAAELVPPPQRLHLQQLQQHRREERHEDGGYIKMPKHDFPHFDATHVCNKKTYMSKKKELVIYLWAAVQNHL